MTKIIAIILQLAAVVGGVMLGLSLKPSVPSDGEADSHESDSDGHGEDGHGKDKKGKKDKGHGKDDGYGDSAANYMKFSRQFIVPVIHNNGVSSLVVLDINLELSPSANDDIYAKEPKIRDALLSTLLKLSNNGAFDERLLHEENLAEIRASLLHAAEEILGEDVAGVLILNIAKQEL